VFRRIPDPFSHQGACVVTHGHARRLVHALDQAARHDAKAETFNLEERELET
jgi:hypothetical protein